ncbi:MAG TPA: PDZ domain-containing protein [Nocardioidaceae bacterium]|nr:PDZ domain-containing protein [Nocardioidaceae bacterium]
MNRRSAAIITAFVLLLALVLVAWQVPAPFARYSPGPTIDILATQTDGKPIVEVSGHKTYKTDGQLRMTTVSTTTRDTSPTLLEALAAWVDPDVDLYPYDVIFPDPGTVEEDREASREEMVDSRHAAVAAALAELGYQLVQVSGLVENGAAKGILRKGDLITKVNGTKVYTGVQVAEIISALTPGDSVSIEVERAGERRTVDIVTKAADDDPERAVVGVFLGVVPELPVTVDVRIPEAIGGPSAGLIFSLAIYDTMTPGALTGGTRIAGTGTIANDGSVGPIGGIRQKIAGAEEDGAELFLVPAENCDEALLVDTDMRLVRADTMHDAVEALEDFVADPDAALPACGEVS